MASKENFAQFNYRIKILAGNNVVLVECKNYESEVFSPQIVNGRITFLNIIPNRRCCQISKSNVMNFAKKELTSSNSLKEQNIKSERHGKFSAKECLAISSRPLAESTPAAVKQKYNCNSQLFQFSRSSATDSTLPTPEPVRRAVPAQSMFLEKSVNNIPRGFKVSRIYHNPAEGTPKKVGRLVLSNSIRNSHHSDAGSLLDGSFKLPCSPILSKHSKKNSVSNHFLHSTPVDCIARWAKVLTPVRTYTRKPKKPLTANRVKPGERMKNPKMPSKVTPTYLRNPTQGLNVSQQIEIKKCKLIKDSKTKISPRSFKKQQTQSVDAYTSKSSFSLHPHSLSFHKPRSYLETMGMSAFDLLTSSNRMMTRKLQEQFRKGCINKASATYVKYKILSTVPPIEQDEQVLELSRISLKTSKAN